MSQNPKRGNQYKLIINQLKVLCGGQQTVVISKKQARHPISIDTDIFIPRVNIRENPLVTLRVKNHQRWQLIQQVKTCAHWLPNQTISRQYLTCKKNPPASRGIPFSNWEKVSGELAEVQCNSLDALRVMEPPAMAPEMAADPAVKMLTGCQSTISRQYLN